MLIVNSRIKPKVLRKMVRLLEKGDNLYTISKKIRQSPGYLKVVIIDFVQKGIKINDKVDRRINTLSEQFKTQISRRLKEGNELKKISSELDIPKYYLKKIIIEIFGIQVVSESNEETVKISNQKQKIKRISKPELKLCRLTKKFGKQIVEILKEGNSLKDISSRLGLRTYVIRKILSKLKKREIIKTDSIVKLRGQRLSEVKKKRILNAKELYDNLQTLEDVAKKLNITRERVRQLLELGEDRGLFVYRPYREVYVENLIKEISKDKIMRELILYGNLNNLKINYSLQNSSINKLLDYYKIDAAYIKRLRRHKMDLKQYQNIVDFLGHHPTTTELSKKSEWRALWFRISYSWGSFDNFRKEYGIPIPKKGYSQFKEVAIPKAIEAIRKRGEERRSVIKVGILNLLDKHRDAKLACWRIANMIDRNQMTTLRCLSELVKEGKLESSKEEEKTFYHLK